MTSESGAGDDEPKPMPSEDLQKTLPGTRTYIFLVCTIVFMLLSSVYSSRVASLRDQNFGYYGNGEAVIAEHHNNAMLCLFGAVGFWTVGMTSLMERAGKRLPVVWHGALGALIGGVLAVPVSQYMPLIGGVIVSFAEPWSPARISTIVGHFIMLVFIGALALGALTAYNDRLTRSPG